MKKPLLFILFMNVVASLHAQHSVKIGTQIPLQYAVQYDYQWNKHWSANAQVGVLTKPYDQVILDVLKAFGVEQSIVNVLTNAFNFGVISQVGTNYHFGKNYVGVTGSWIHLQAADTPISAIQTAFNVNVGSYPVRPRQNAQSPIAITLSSDLYNAGILYGRRFTFKNPKIEIHTEFSFSKTLASSSYVESPQRSLENLSELIDTELKSDYSSYGYLPSINVFFVYKLGVSKN
ncbi:MAG: hypothetical protein HOP30_05345 [Cyclobacteriaceae bacterium]|nr:hypothetical protein [Cyclobacteriaceae bacterium]